MKHMMIYFNVDREMAAPCGKWNYIWVPTGAIKSNAMLAFCCLHKKCLFPLEMKICLAKHLKTERKNPYFPHNIFYSLQIGNKFLKGGKNLIFCVLDRMTLFCRRIGKSLILCDLHFLLAEKIANRPQGIFVSFSIFVTSSL